MCFNRTENQGIGTQKHGMTRYSVPKPHVSEPMPCFLVPVPCFWDPPVQTSVCAISEVRNLMWTLAYLVQS